MPVPPPAPPAPPAPHGGRRGGRLGRLGPEGQPPAPPALPLTLPLYFTAAIVALTVAGKAGDALAPGMVVSAPTLLLALNANDLHLALTANLVPRVPWMVVGMLRRLAEDPVFFLIGWWYRDDAMRWLASRSPALGRKVAKIESFFRRASYAAVIVEPGMVVCCLAGAAQMSVSMFFILNVGGTLARLAAIRALSERFPNQVEALLEVVEAYKPYFLLAAVSVTAASSWNALGLLSPTKPETRAAEAMSGGDPDARKND